VHSARDQDAERSALLGKRISELGLRLHGTALEKLIDQLYAELRARPEKREWLTQRSFSASSSWPRPATPAEILARDSDQPTLQTSPRRVREP
jgi:hypothetical protein